MLSTQTGYPAAAVADLEAVFRGCTLGRESGQAPQARLVDEDDQPDFTLDFFLAQAEGSIMRRIYFLVPTVALARAVVAH